MNNAQETIEVAKKPEAPKGPEIPQDVESPEELRQQILTESETEVSSFKKEGEGELAQAEDVAQKEGLMVDSADKEALTGLNQEVDAAKAELLGEINSGKEQQFIPDQVLAKTKVCTKCGAEGVVSANFCTQCGSKFEQEQSAIKKQSNPPPLPQEYRATPPPLPKKVEVATKERKIEDPKLLSKKEASEKFLAEERVKLLEEIRVQRERLATLKKDIKNTNASFEGMGDKAEDRQYGKLTESQSAEATAMAERIFLVSGLNEQDAQSELENILQLVEDSAEIKSIKAKIEEHYAKADAIAKEHFDTLNRSLEHVIKRNNAFVVHKLEERDELRHNANSNVSSEVTYEDDIDILLSLEPSISASSVTPGEKTRLWPGASGFLLGGGQIGEAGSSDIGTQALGIKKRGGLKDASITKIDEVVGRRDKWAKQDFERFGEHGMNEVVVNNPEVFGFFQHVGRDERGRFWAKNKDTRILSEEIPGHFRSGPDDPGNRAGLKNIVNSYRKRFSSASERGIPLYIMTEEREVYEFLNINDDGTIEVGKKLTPEQVATGKAGLPPEKRKQIGERLLGKKIFRKQETQEEAREIIDNLATI